MRINKRKRLPSTILTTSVKNDQKKIELAFWKFPILNILKYDDIESNKIWWVQESRVLII